MVTIKNALFDAGTSPRALSDKPILDSYKNTIDAKILPKFQKLKSWNDAISRELLEIDADLGAKLVNCGAYLQFRHFLESGATKLKSGNYCNNHLLCPCCSAARSRRLLAKYLPVLSAYKSNRIHLYMLTLTWPPTLTPALGASASVAGHHVCENHSIEGLRANLSIGIKAWGKLWARKKMRSSGALKNVLGAVLSMEVTYSEKHGWHPHFHVIIATDKFQGVSATELYEDWKNLGGGSVRISPIRKLENVIEIFKYAVKPLEADKKNLKSAVQTRYKIYQALKGSRLIRGYGDFFNFGDIVLGDEDLSSFSGAYVDFFYKWCKGNYKLIDYKVL